MKKPLLGLIVGLMVGAIVTSLILRGPAAATDKPADAPAAPEESPLHYTAEQMKKAGIVLTAPNEVEVKPECRAFGRVLETASLISLVTELASAKSTLSISEKELARVHTLNALGGNASAHAVEAAESAATIAQLQLGSARARLVAGWGRAFADKVEQGWLQENMDKQWSLVRLDFPIGEKPGSMPASVNVSLIDSEDDALECEMIGAAPSVDPQIQGTAYLVILNGRSLPIGAALKASVTGEGTGKKFLSVPTDAIVYHQGSPWVYVMGYKDTFERRLVQLGPVVPNGYVVSDGLAKDDQIAVSGAQQLLSGELQAASGG